MLCYKCGSGVMRRQNQDTWAWKCEQCGNTEVPVARGVPGDGRAADNVRSLPLDSADVLRHGIEALKEYMASQRPQPPDPAAREREIFDNIVMMHLGSGLQGHFQGEPTSPVERAQEAIETALTVIRARRALSALVEARAPASPPTVFGSAGQWKLAAETDVFLPLNYEPGSIAGEIAATRSYQHGCVTRGEELFPALRYDDGRVMVLHPAV